MRRLAAAVIAAGLIAATPASATWSIVAVDQDTGRISMATASCVDVPTDHFYRDLVGVIVPGVGIDVPGRHRQDP